MKLFLVMRVCRCVLLFKLAWHWVIKSRGRHLVLSLYTCRQTYSAGSEFGLYKALSISD